MPDTTPTPADVNPEALADQVAAFSESLDGVSAKGRAFLDGAQTALRAVAGRG